MKKTILNIIIATLGIIPLITAAAGAAAPAAPAHTVEKTPTAMSRNLSTTKLVTAGLSALIGVIVWAHSQHQHSKIGHERYPLTQRRNIIKELLASKLARSEQETLKDELEEIQYRLNRIHTKKSKLNGMRILSALAAIAGGATLVYGIRKKKPAAA